MSYHVDKLIIDTQTDGQMDTHSDAGNVNTQSPKMALGKNHKI